MEVADDVYVIIVGQADQNITNEFENIDQDVDIKLELLDELTDVCQERVVDLDIVKKEGTPELHYDSTIPEIKEILENVDDIEHNSNNENSSEPAVLNTYGKQYKMRKPWEKKSFVNELKHHCPELHDDQNLLVETLALIMTSVKPPPPPRDYFVMTEAKFECATCGVIRETNSAAWRHYQERHGLRYLICFACGEDFRSTTNLYKHEKRCKAPDALIVLKARARWRLLPDNNRIKLKVEEPKIEWNAGKAPVTAATRRKNVVYHPRRKATSYKCDLCSAKYKTAASLQAHKLKHEGVRPFLCSKCPAAYTSLSGLKAHFVKHTDVEFICDLCKHSFKAKDVLVKHMYTHLPLKKYPCEHCGRRYAQKFALQRHIDKIHFNLPPPCACTMCPKRYARMSLLKVHMLKEHGMNLMTRNMFFRCLPNLSEEQMEEARGIINNKDCNAHTVIFEKENNLED